MCSGFYLLRRALVVAVILPPGQQAREPLRWEILRAIEVGLLGRLFFVLPPPDGEGYESTRAALRELQDLLPGLESATPDSIIIHPHNIENLEWYYLLGGTAADVTYAEIFRKILTRIKLDLADRPFTERYPYWKGRRKLSIAPKLLN